MIVLDASAIVEILSLGPLGEQIKEFLKEASEPLHAPELLRCEVLQVLRKLELKSKVPKARVGEALSDFLDFPITYHSHEALLQRVWELRFNFTSYDAQYLALAEALGAKLVTTDKALKTSKKHYALTVLFDS